MAGQFEHKVVLITGSGRGIGRAAAELFAREGASVVLCARTTREIRAVASAIRAKGGRAVARRADIGSVADARALVREALRHFGRLDVLINNAGILGPRVALTDYPTRDWQHVIRMNLTGTFYVTREAVPVMVAQGTGCIITISSSVGRAGRAQWGAYAVSKFGSEGLMQVLADELRSTGIVVMTFNPGGTRTRMRADAYPDEDPKALPDPSQPAHALLRLAANASPALSGRAFDMHTVP